MASTPSSSLALEQRILAAIVFTDVAGFSARVQREESATLKLLERDFAAMREFSTELSGAVLKSTGDGLLLYFTSAVQAVTWALKTQRHFQKAARNAPASEILRHRIGVHLGDVFATADDVMGDGVNIAARVQAEAPPGGICISQVVYDVVKTKLKLEVVRLEPRKLKNISETIQMYHLLLDPPQRISGPATAAKPVPAAERSTPRPKKAMALAVVLLVVGLLGWLLLQAHFEHEKELVRSQAAHVALGALLTENQGRQAGAGPAPSEEPAQKASPANGLVAPEFDFAKLARDRDVALANDERVQRQANECIQSLNAWLPVRLQSYTRERGLLVRPLRDASGQNFTLFIDQERRLNLAEGGAFRKRDWADLKPDLQGAIIVSALRDLPSPPRNVVRGAEAFAYLHRLPEMALVLIRDQRSRDASSR